MINQSWKGKRVFVTGHTGFKGSWLTAWLRELGAEVYGYALKPETDRDLFRLLELEGKIHNTYGDVRDLNRLLEAMKTANPHVVLHLAAQPLVRRSYKDPIETYSTNVMGTVNVLEAARSAEALRVLINVTTDKVYENYEWDWPYRENDRLGGFDPYSNSKACSELVTASYRSSFFNKAEYSKHRVSIATARAGNVIGGGDWAEDRLIPDLIRAFEGKRKLVIRSPGAIRPWQHVLESVSGYLRLAEHLFDSGGEYFDSWNFGPASESFVTVEEITKQVARGSGGIKVDFELGTSELHEAKILKLDNSLAREKLGWVGRWDHARAVDETLAWYSAYLAGKDPFELTLSQIRNFSHA